MVIKLPWAETDTWGSSTKPKPVLLLCRLAGMVAQAQEVVLGVAKVGAMVVPILVAGAMAIVAGKAAQ